MTRETFFSLLRTLLTSVGVFLIGKNLLGSTIDQSILEMIIGIVMSLGSVIWSIFDKTLAIEMLQSFLRQAVVGLGGLMVAKGVLSPEKLEAYVGLVTVLVPFIYGIFSRRKSAKIEAGTLPVEKLSK